MVLVRRMQKRFVGLSFTLERWGEVRQVILLLGNFRIMFVAGGVR